MRKSGMLVRALVGAGMMASLIAPTAARAADATPPAVSISDPTEGAVVVGSPRVLGGGLVSNEVTIRGVATDDVKVAAVLLRIYRGPSATNYTVNDCVGCGTPNATWSVKLPLLPGLYVAEALAADTAANLATSVKVQFVVV